MTVHILILAAGASARMRGGDKCLEAVGGEALLRRLARFALGTGCGVTVALPPDRPARGAALAGLPLSQVIVPDAAQGMAASIVAGLGAVPQGLSVMLVLADLPMLEQADLQRMLAVAQDAPEAILRGAEPDGAAGHPVLFPPRYRAELARLRGDAGARSVLARHGAAVRLVPLPQGHATTDLDTPEAWAEWRASRD